MGQNALKIRTNTPKIDKNSKSPPKPLVKTPYFYENRQIIIPGGTTAIYF